VTKAYIFGAGGQARVVASFLNAEVVFVADDPQDSSVMSTEDYFARRPAGEAYVGIGANRVRQRFLERLAAAGISTPPCIAPTAWVARDALIEDGAVICAGAVIGTRASIGRGAIVNTLSSVDHDCTLGSYTQVTVGVTIAGAVKVGENCFFGMKSGVIPNKTIGDNVQVRAGSLVVSDVEANVLMGGNPAQIIRRL
jgi:sugar O-acyltransferase (sialic acid O-acetyltransferase NeuD family)